jgi:hypothetical protein
MAESKCTNLGAQEGEVLSGVMVGELGSMKTSTRSDHEHCRRADRVDRVQLSLGPLESEHSRPPTARSRSRASRRRGGRGAERPFGCFDRAAHGVAESPESETAKGPECPLHPVRFVPSLGGDPGHESANHSPCSTGRGPALVTIPRCGISLTRSSQAARRPTSSRPRAVPRRRPKG